MTNDTIVVYESVSYGTVPAGIRWDTLYLDAKYIYNAQGRTKMGAVTPGLLFVDDALPIHVALLSTLATLSYAVRVASDAFTARARFGRRLPDLVLSDLNAPSIRMIAIRVVTLAPIWISAHTISGQPFRAPEDIVAGSGHGDGSPVKSNRSCTAV